MDKDEDAGTSSSTNIIGINKDKDIDNGFNNTIIVRINMNIRK